MYEISSPLARRTEAGRLCRVGICTKATEHGISSRLLLRLLLLRLLWAKRSWSLSERCPAGVKNEGKKLAIREITHPRSDQIHQSDQKPIRQADPVADFPSLSRT